MHDWNGSLHRLAISGGSFLIDLQLLQLRVLRPRVLADGNFGFGICPKPQEIFIRRLSSS